MNNSEYAVRSGVQSSPLKGGGDYPPRKAGGRKILGMKKSHFFFYVSVVAFPILQFLVFYIYMNLNSLVLAFQKWDFDAGKFVWNGLGNFKEIFGDLVGEEKLNSSIKNSLLLFFFNLIFSNFGTIILSYYIYKNRTFSKIFKVILYAPHIISNIIMVLIYTEFIDTIIPKIWLELFNKEIYGLLTIGGVSRYISVLFFCVWISFGTQVLVYSGTMSSISDSVIESAKLDGVTPIRELFSIVIPMIWPTIITFLLSALAGIFTNQMFLFSFFGANADPSLYTFGYYLYVNVQQGSMSDYPPLAALGVLMTCVAAPITLLIKRMLEKYGPSTI